MATIVQRRDTDFNTQINIFCNKIDTYSALFALDAAEVTSIKRDCDFFAYTLEALNTFSTFGEGITNYKALLRFGQDSQVLPAFPAIPALAVAPTLVAANIDERFRRLIQKIVAHQSYTTTIGEDLGIEKPKTVFDPQTGKPVFKIIFSSGGQPQLVWKKGQFQGVEIWKSTGAAFTKLDRDMKPDFIDKADLPAAGTSAVWKYKMIYLFNDETVGSWSDEVVVTVYGNV
jgi:hypothetical protein